MKIAVFDKNGKDTGREITLDETIFGIDPSKHSLYLEVKQFLAAQRQGTHKTKERNEVVGSTRKLHRQKGTGGSRKGDIKNPLYKGGGRIFGPKPRDYSFKLNKSIKKLAKKSALSTKMANNQIKVVEDFTFETPKTKEFITLLQNFELKNKKSLFILGEPNNNVYLSSRNLDRTKVTSYSEISSYDLVNANELIIFESSLEKFQENLRKK